MDPAPPDINRSQSVMERSQAVMDPVNYSPSVHIKLKDISEVRRPTVPYIHPLGIALPPYSTSYGRQETTTKTQKPKDYVLWSFFSYLFCNCCCLGFIALIYSFKARDRHIMGDSERADTCGRKARNLNSAALIISIFFIMLAIILLATVVTTHTVTLNQILQAIKSYLTY